MDFASSSPKSNFIKNMDNLGGEVGQPSINQFRVNFGVITSVSEKNQVQVKLYDVKDSKGNERLVLEGRHIPVFPQLEIIHMLYGALRPGLQVMVYWRGRLTPNWAIAHIIGDETLNILEKPKQVNKAIKPPTKFVSGGLSF